MKYLLNLTYDGSKFYGWQKQKRWETVQGNIEASLSQILNRKIIVMGASRTDRGVHANDQYATFKYGEIKDLNKFAYSVNKLTSESIYIKSIYRVPDDFSARYDAKMKEYVYKINVGMYNPLEKDYVFQYNKYINVRLLKRAAKKISGKHDFKSFTSDNEKTNYVRKINSIKVIKKGDYVYIYLQAKGFLRYMVRNIVGLLLDINENEITVEEINKIFEAKDRSAAGRKAEACGLYLNKIKYK